MPLSPHLWLFTKSFRFAAVILCHFCLGDPVALYIFRIAIKTGYGAPICLQAGVHTLQPWNLAFFFFLKPTRKLYTFPVWPPQGQYYMLFSSIAWFPSSSTGRYRPCTIHSDFVDCIC